MCPVTESIGIRLEEEVVRRRGDFKEKFDVIGE